jgi:hypothetical protein
MDRFADGHVISGEAQIRGVGSGADRKKETEAGRNCSGARGSSRNPMTHRRPRLGGPITEKVASLPPKNQCFRRSQPVFLQRIQDFKLRYPSNCLAF